MKRTLWTLCVVAAIETFRISNVAQAAETNVFSWVTRPQLTADQEKMLQLQKSVEITRQDSPLHTQDRAKLTDLQKKLGPVAVRTARPNELTISRINTNVFSIHNPTSDGLVLTVSIVGDVEQLGTQIASMGREAYFPPGSTIVITNLYWTTPSTAKRETH